LHLLRVGTPAYARAVRVHGVVERPDGAAVAEFPAEHPCPSTLGEPPFRVRSGGGRLRLTGCVDTFCAEGLAATLVGTPIDGSLVVLDLGGLEFADAAATRVVARWVQGLHAAGVAVHVTGAPHFFVRVWHLLAFDQVSPAVFGEPPG
jgi:hypothetical protein